MRIGDRVRLLKGTEEGHIVSIKGNIVEIEIEDGFSIPAVKNEVVVVDRKESEVFADKKQEIDESTQISRQTSIAEGIYLGLENNNSISCYMINQSPDVILFSVCVWQKKNLLGLSYGICKPFEAKEIGNTSMNEFKREVQFQVQVIHHDSSSKSRKSPIAANLVIKESQLTDKVTVHALDRAIAIFNLESLPQPEIDTLKMKEQMMEGKPEMAQKDKSFSKQELIIDLHLDAQSSGLPENEILRSQLESFEKSFDQALLNNAKSLKVIHGIGSGKLRREIHKRISQRSEVHYFEDGDREKFGFGSTIIYF